MAQGPRQPGPPSLLGPVSPTENQKTNDVEGDGRWDGAEGGIKGMPLLSFPAITTHPFPPTPSSQPLPPGTHQVPQLHAFANAIPFA